MSNGSTVTNISPAGAGLVSTTQSRYSVIRPDLLPTMQVLQTISTEDILAARMNQLISIWNKYDPPNAAQYDVGNLEFDPIKINQELNAYFELLVRDRVNQAARAVTLAFSTGSDIDAIASRYPGGVPRLTVANGTWNGPGTQEPDATYKARIWLSPNILSLAGPGQGVYESYKFWALSAPQFAGELPLKDASAFTVPHTGNVYLALLPDAPINTTWLQDPLNPNAWSLSPGEVVIPSSNQIEAVYEYITAPYMGRMGLTDVLNVIRPSVTNTTIDADIILFPGVDQATLMAETCAAVGQLITAINWIGADLTMMAFEGALAQSGVYNTIIRQPTGDVVVDNKGVINVLSARLRYIGTGE
jgi:phage-related baseplate assembly protein